EKAVGETPTGGDRDRRQIYAADDIADCIDAGYVGGLIGVGHDIAVRVGGHPRRPQIQAVGIGASSDCPYQAVHAFYRFAIFERNAKACGFFFYFCDFATVDYAHSVRDHLRHQFPTQHDVKIIQEVRTTDHHRHLATERPQQTSQFDGDIASADDCDVLRLLLQFKEAIGRNAERCPGQVWHERATADRNDNVFGRERVGTDLDCFRADEARPTPHDGHAVFCQRALMGSLQVEHMLVALSFENTPVEGMRWNGKTVVRCFIQRMGEVGAVPHDLLRHAADIHACAADAARFHQRALRAVACCAIGDCDAAAAATDGEEIEVPIHSAEFGNARM